MKSFTIALLLASLLTSLTGCGTLLHPERKGQIGGSIDPGIVILDSVGLLFFLSLASLLLPSTLLTAQFIYPVAIELL